VSGEMETIGLHREERPCVPMWKNCSVAKCCSVPGTTCYKKDATWAQCKPACTPGPDPVDADSRAWDCEALGPRKKGEFDKGRAGEIAHWVKGTCVGPGQNCTESRCCKQAGQQCFKKNDNWASCKNMCIPGVDPTDGDSGKWECKALGGKTPGAQNWEGYRTAPWVQNTCSATGENCAHTGCCKDSGMQCFRRDDDHAECLRTCHPGPVYTDPSGKDWNCTALGGPTPGRMPPTSKDAFAKMQENEWVKKKCSWAPSKWNNYTGQNCIHSRCCQEAGKQCYSMDETFGLCMNSCLANNPTGPNRPLKNSDGQPWECKKLGQRAPHEWGSPSLYCFSVFRMSTYEGDIMKNQLNKQIGIFACDLFSLFSSDPEKVLGDSRDGELSWEHFDPAPVGVSTDGTAGNTGLFMNVWEAVRYGGKYNLCDWTLKADPDAVVMPDRMRVHIQHMPQGSFLNNCPKFSDSPLFGSVEVISRGALDKYYANEVMCRSMPWGGWGEDKWITKCLSSEGAQSQMDAGMVGDALCMGQNCGDGKAAYHPLKSVGVWMSCWYQASAGQPLP